MLIKDSNADKRQFQDDCWFIFTSYRQHTDVFTFDFEILRDYNKCHFSDADVVT